MDKTYKDIVKETMNRDRQIKKEMKEKGKAVVKTDKEIKKMLY